MSLSILSPSRTVLLISDEFLSVMTVNNGGVKLVEALPWAAENFEDNVANIIAKDCGKKPVLILNDMVEQHYRKEKIIRTGVNVIDRTAMVKRKLNVAFPNYPIKAAYALKEKVSKSGAQPAAGIYIFAAVSGSEQINKTVSATSKSLASVAGFCLLPVESSDMVKALSLKKGGKNKRGKQNVWAVFVGQHNNGSLRQILTKNGELALTRMSPMIDTDQDPQAWASALHNEFKSTMSYLARFGYDADDGLDAFVIAGSEAGDALKSMFDEDCDLHVMPITEAASILGVRIGRQNEERYADALHVAWAGRKSRFLLPLNAAQLDKISSPRKAAMLVALVLFAGASYLAYQAASKAGKLSEISSQTDVLKQQKTQLDAQYQRELQRLKDVGFDAQLVQGSIAVQAELEKQRIKVLALFQNVGRALGKDLRVDSVNINRPKKNIITDAYNTVQNQKEKLFTATLKMTYPSTADIERGNTEVENLRGRIQSLLPDHEVNVTKFLKDYEYTEGLIVEAGDLKKQDVEQDFVAEIQIKGPVPE